MGVGGGGITLSRPIVNLGIIIVSALFKLWKCAPGFNTKRNQTSTLMWRRECVCEIARVSFPWSLCQLFLFSVGLCEDKVEPNRLLLFICLKTY